MMTGRRLMMGAAIGAALITRTASANAQGGSPCATGKIAIVQGQVILASMPTYITADSLLTKQEEVYRLELAKMQGTFDSARSALSDKSAMLSASVRTAETKKLDDQYQQLQQRVTELQQKAAQERQQMLQPMELRVQGVIDGMRAEYNCAVIFDANTQGNGIISIDKSIDLTQRVIDRLKAAGATAPPATKGPPKPAGSTTPIKP